LRDANNAWSTVLNRETNQAAANPRHFVMTVLPPLLDAVRNLPEMDESLIDRAWTELTEAQRLAPASDLKSQANQAAPQSGVVQFGHYHSAICPCYEVVEAPA
jgi:hypothetical protein